MQSQAGEAKKYKVMADYLEKQGVAVQLTGIADYREVLELVTKGRANKVIAGDLSVSQRTVERLGLSAGEVLHVGDSPVEDYAGAEAAFRTGSLQLFQVVFARTGSNAVPWVRAGVAIPQRVLPAVDHAVVAAKWAATRCIQTGP